MTHWGCWTAKYVSFVSRKKYCFQFDMPLARIRRISEESINCSRLKFDISWNKVLLNFFRHEKLIFSTLSARFSLRPRTGQRSLCERIWRRWRYEFFSAVYIFKSPHFLIFFVQLTQLCDLRKFILWTTNGEKRRKKEKKWMNETKEIYFTQKRWEMEN